MPRSEKPRERSQGRKPQNRLELLVGCWSRESAYDPWAMAALA
jgi:hypothetical protein